MTASQLSSRQASAYQVPPFEDDGVICSRRFPGLWLAVETMLRGEMAGLRSSEHAAFVEQR